jgi:hypothetical protein
MLSWNEFYGKWALRDQCTTLTFAWKSQGKPQEPSVRIPDALHGIRTRKVRNTNSERYKYIKLPGEKGC